MTSDQMAERRLLLSANWHGRQPHDVLRLYSFMEQICRKSLFWFVARARIRRFIRRNRDQFDWALTCGIQDVYAVTKAKIWAHPEAVFDQQCIAEIYAAMKELK